MHGPPHSHSLPLPSPALTQFKKVDPVGSRVVVEVDKAESTSAGGILLPTAAQVKRREKRGRDGGRAGRIRTPRRAARLVRETRPEELVYTSWAPRLE